TYALPAIVGFIQVMGTYFASHRQTGYMDFDGVAALLLLAGPVALVFRNLYPIPVLGITFVTTVAYGISDYPRGPMFLALFFASMKAVMRGHRIAFIATLVGVFITFLWGPAVVGTGPSPALGQIFGVGAWLLVLGVGTEFMRSRRAEAIEMARTRREESRRQQSEERLRIARDLHDVLAHNISLINVQAGVALHLLDERPEQARTALSAIKDASNEALGELRSVLDILRLGEEGAPRRPTSGLAHVDELIGRTEAAGIEVTKNVTGALRQLPLDVDVAAFRIVQESLTNVARHAGDATVTIVITYGDDELIVQIDDDGKGAATPTSGGGNGVPGMKERAASLGGELTAGPRPGGGFRVRAVLPVEEKEGSP
ncbi:MAG: sensor histidine kinase, partial [Actinobacteria bacterium]|nr:sensor histidine kinase [Actinomycetota bacterium]